MRKKIETLLIFAIAGIFLYSGVTCFVEHLYLESFLQAFASSMFVGAGITYWRKKDSPDDRK